MFTDLDAPRGRICVADPAAPGPENWRDLVVEDPSAVLRSYAVLDGPELARPVLVVARARHAVSEVSVHDLATGEFLRALDLPGIGTVGGIAERPEGGHEAWFVYTDYTTSSVVLRFDARDSSVTTWATAGRWPMFGGRRPPRAGGQWAATTLLFARFTRRLSAGLQTLVAPITTAKTVRALRNF